MIKNITEQLKKDLQKYESIPERIEALKDSYKGETCYIVSAGPSLKNYEPEYLKSKLENKLVFTIKQSYLLLKEICDFHILNFTNFEPYQWLNETIVAWEVFEQYHPQMILENGFNVDVMFPVIRNHGTMDNTQAARLDFDDFTMDKTYDRAWGPGLMYEMAIPFFTDRTYGVSPGITGLAQIKQGYDTSIEDVRNKVGYDHSYALALSKPSSWLKMDLSIILGTIAVMFKGKGQ